MTQMLRYSVLLTPLLAALLGCEPQATPLYLGEPLGSITGTIESDLASAAPEAELVLLWINWRTAPGTVMGVRAPVSGEFPSGFNMTLYTPPPVDALNELPESPVPERYEPRLGFAWILVMKKGAAAPERDLITHADVKGLQPGDVLGWAEDYVLAYVDGIVADENWAPQSWASQIMNGAIEPGFHLMKAPGMLAADLADVAECKGQGGAGASAGCLPDIEPLMVAEQGMQTPIPVRLTERLNELRIPVFALPPAVEEAFGVVGDAWRVGEGGS